MFWPTWPLMSSSSSSTSQPCQECWRDVKLSPSKLKTMASPIKILPDRPEGIAHHKYGFFCEKFELERLSFCKTMAEQAWVIEEHCKVKTKEVPGDPEWKFSNQEKGLLFGVGRQQFGHPKKNSREKNSLYLNSPRTQKKEHNCFQEKFIKKKETKTYSKNPPRLEPPTPPIPK